MRGERVRTWAVAPLLAAAACTASVDFAGANFRCGADRACPSGTTCLDGECRDPTATDGAGGDTILVVADATAIPDAQNPDAPACLPVPGCALFACASSCYLTCDVGETFQDAALACEEWGGQLAIIEDPDEDGCIRGFVGGAFTGWFGLVQDALGSEPDGGWHWLNGMPLTYQNWTSGEPNNNGGNEDCGAFHDIAPSWNDAGCGQIKSFVCEQNQ